MTDILSPAQRSERMSRIRSSDTKPEIALRKVLHAAGLRFRLHRKELPGRPDLVFPRYHAIVFVNGCFWHRHQACSIATSPKSNVEAWQKKFATNVARDRRNQEELNRAGWRVFVIWECEVSSKKKALITGTRLAEEIRKFDTTKAPKKIAPLVEAGARLTTPSAPVT